MAYILIVEDHPVNARLFETYVVNMGHRAKCAVDVAAALVLTGSNKFDLIITDVALPGPSGLEFATMMRADPVHMHTPILCITAFYAMHTDEMAIKAGCTEYAGKPMSMNMLKQTIDNMLSKGQKP